MYRTVSRFTLFIDPTTNFNFSRLIIETNQSTIFFFYMFSYHSQVEPSWFGNEYHT